MPADPTAGCLQANPAIPHPTLEIDARIVAVGLGISPQEVEPGRQDGSITTLCERGTGKDAGLLRATFYRGRRRLRVVIDAHGHVIEQDATAVQPIR